MAEDKILTWNVANWITVLIMVTLGFAVLGMAVKLWQAKKGKAVAA
jgi:hypothetical protein